MHAVCIQLEKAFKQDLVNFATARKSVRDLASWTGERLFHQVFPHRRHNIKERRLIWEVFDQGVLPNRSLRNMLNATGELFYPKNRTHPEW
eukprot:1427071-Pyramimonas_sp.AAC.1